jgi:hypothetical protein
MCKVFGFNLIKLFIVIITITILSCSNVVCKNIADHATHRFSFASVYTKYTP